MAAEAVLIVVSILLAFGIDAWWDERKERKEELEILRGLQQEFTLNRAIIQDQLEIHRNALVAMETLLRAAERGSWDSVELSIDDALGAALSPPTTDLGGGVRDALISAGRIDVLSNSALRAKLIAWENVLGEMQDDEVMGRELVFDLIIPYLARHGVPFANAFDTYKKHSWVPVRSIAGDHASADRLLTDPEFATILEVRFGFKLHGTEEYEDVIAAADEILAEIDKSLSYYSRQE